MYCQIWRELSAICGSPVYNELCYNHQEDSFAEYNDNTNTSALHMACAHNCIESVEFFLHLPREIMNPNDAEHDGSTPLHTAVMNHCYPIIELLLKHKDISPNVRDIVTEVRYQKITEWDVECCSDIYWDKPYAKEKYANTPLHLACYKNDITAVTLLLGHKKTRIIPRNHNYENPFHIVCKYGFNELFQLLINAIKKRGENPRDYLWLKTQQGDTPIDLAYTNNHEKIIEQLRQLIQNK